MSLPAHFVKILFICNFNIENTSCPTYGLTSGIHVTKCPLSHFVIAVTYGRMSQKYIMYNHFIHNQKKLTTITQNM